MGMLVRCLAVVALLSGCYFQSPVNLHAGLVSFKPSQFLSGQNATFRADDGDHIFVQFDTKGAVDLIRSRLKVSGTNYTRHISEIVRDPAMPEGVYMAVYPSSGKYGYFPFYYGKSGMGMMFPSETVDVADLAGLRREVAAIFPKRKTYKQLSTSDAAAALNRYKAVNAEKARKKQENTEKSPTTPKPTAPQSAPPAGIARLDVGDGVYVQGLLSDELVQVVRIDLGTGQVKVRRSTDGTTLWVHHTRIITREQATANNVGRVGVGFALAFCLFNPNACKK